jgi:hypothetical protein
MLYTPAGGQYMATESGAGAVASIFIFTVEQSLFDYQGQSFSSQIYILSLVANLEKEITYSSLRIYWSKLFQTLQILNLI